MSAGLFVQSFKQTTARRAKVIYRSSCVVQEASLRCANEALRNQNEYLKHRSLSSDPLLADESHERPREPHYRRWSARARA